MLTYNSPNEKTGEHSMKKRASFLISCLLLMNLFSACAVIEQKAVLNPDLIVVESNIGHGKEIGVKVVDRRFRNTLGHRGAALLSKGAAITTNQDIGEVFAQKIEEGLTRKGFEPAALNENSSRSLQVEIRALEYYTSTGFWTGGVHTKTALKAIARNGMKEYEQFYRVENEERVILVPSAEENEQLINTVISEVLRKLFSDKTLLQFLSN